MKKTLLYAFIATLVIAIVSPLNVISSNPDDFHILNGTSFLLHLVSTFFILFMSIALIYFILYKLFKENYYIIVFLTTIVVIWSLYLPLPTGKLDGVDQIGISLINIILGIFIGFIVVFYRNKAHLILLIMIVGPLILSIITVTEKVNFKSQTLLKLSKEKTY
jgi:hypothetical protein